MNRPGYCHEQSAHKIWILYLDEMRLRKSRVICPIAGGNARVDFLSVLMSNSLMNEIVVCGYLRLKYNRILPNELIVLIMGYYCGQCDVHVFCKGLTDHWKCKLKDILEVEPDHHEITLKVDNTRKCTYPWE